MDVIWRPDGALDVVQGKTYQLNREWGLIVIDSAEVAWWPSQPSLIQVGKINERLVRIAVER